MNFSFTYFRNVTLQLVRLYCLKPSKLWRTGDFFLVHPSLSKNSQIIFIFIFIIFIFLNFWNVAPRFPSLNVHLPLPDKSRSVLSSKSYPCMKWFDGASTGICLSVFLYSFNVSKIKIKKIKSRGKVHFQGLQVTVITPN